ncbi:hypothetical protein ILUMI_21707 [Ignelater luminosus]|uniref:Uncharacterized protein n=1 Tax=Ignelater luminosus TaxID=2038154 RepID=A0A8K0CBY2_IGNLU|nr:hypothetical protein ILUMI_21707 [Ignelater luminosus]
MKLFVVIAVVVVVAVAEPPAGPIFIARYSAAPQQQAPVVPFPISGARPRVHVLARQQVPQTAYNPPQATVTEAEGNSTEDSVIESSTEPQSEQIQTQTKKNPKDKNEKLLEIAQGEPVDQGVYYLYHPSGVLQRVAYATSNDVKNMAYVAQLKYQDVEPIREPIYTYDPETFLLQQVAV